MYLTRSVCICDLDFLNIIFSASILYIFVVCSTYCSTSNMKATCISKTTVNFYHTTHHHISEDKCSSYAKSRYTALASANKITKHIGRTTAHLMNIKCNISATC
jgi:outer membrane protein assembly factor BamD (BamD/ComL family)